MKKLVPASRVSKLPVLLATLPIIAAAFLLFGQVARAAIIPSIYFPAEDGIGGTTINSNGTAGVAITTTGTLGGLTSVATGGSAVNNTAPLGIWGGSGTSANGTTGVTVSSDVAGLTYSGLDTLGGAFVVKVDGTQNNNRACVQFANVASGNVYASFLVQLHATPTANKTFACFSTGTAGSSQNAPFCGIGFNTLKQLSIATGTGTPSTFGTTTETLDTTIFIVMRYSFAAGRFDIFRNPSVGGAEPTGAGDLTVAATAPSVMNTFSVQSYTGSGTTYLDDFRWSSNAVTGWSIVNPAPLVCTPPGVGSGPSNQVATVGGTATFAIGATGSTTGYKWQVSNNGGSSWNNVGNSSASYTTPTLGNPDNGNQYRCIVSASCTAETATSQVATVSVTDPAGKYFHSFQSGNWNDINTWQQSDDNNTWNPATTTPNSTSANITIQAGHIVTVTAAVDADQLVVQATGEIDASGAVFTINDGAAATDADVSGILKVANIANSAITANGQLKFENGSKFTCALPTATTIPTATWAANSTCEIAPAAAGSFVPGGLSQSFGNFVWNWPSQSASVILGGALTNVQGDFEITPSSAGSFGFCFGKKPDTALDTLTVTVGGAIKAHTGTGNFLLGTGTELGTYLTKVGKGIIVDTGGKLDMGNPGAGTGGVTVQFTGNSELTLNGITMGNPNAASYVVDNGATLALNSPVTVGATRAFTVNGTLNFNTNQITVNGGLTNNGTLIGNGTTALTTGTGSIAYGGTLNLPGLPTFVGGESFVLFGAAAWSGTFTSIVPFAPGAGLSWDTTQLTTSGMLAVTTGGSGGGPVRVSSTKRFGTDIVLTIDGGVGNANTNFSVLTSPNIALPVSSWTEQATGLSLDGSGVALYTNAISGSKLFYNIRIP